MTFCNGCAGIVRRMDELGRIVIPKELRRTLRIREGDEMEIFSDGETLLVRKYCRLESFVRTAEVVAKELARKTCCEVLVVASDKIVAAAGERRKETQGKTVAKTLSDVLAEKRNVAFSVDGSYVVSDGIEIVADGVSASPVNTAGDVTGFIVCVGKGAVAYADFVILSAEILGTVLV